MVDEMLKDYPGVAVTFTVLGAIGAFALRMLEGLLRHLFKRKGEQEDKRVSDLEDGHETHRSDIAELRAAQARMNAEMKAHAGLVERHLDNEERTVWPRLNKFGERLARIEGAVDSIKDSVQTLLDART